MLPGWPTPGIRLARLLPPPTKGKATPKRREAEAARKVSAIGGSGRAVRGTGKGGRLTPEQARVRREAMRRGDDSALPLRDRGPARRYARDYVDSRRNVLGLFVPVAVPVILLGIRVSARQGRRPHHRRSPCTPTFSARSSTRS